MSLIYTKEKNGIKKYYLGNIEFSTLQAAEDYLAEIKNKFIVHTAKATDMVVISSELIRVNKDFQEFLRSNDFHFNRDEGGFVGFGTVEDGWALVSEMTGQKKTIIKERHEEIHAQVSIGEDTSQKINDILKNNAYQEYLDYQ